MEQCWICVRNMASTSPSGYFGYDLKLINGNQARLIRFFQITEYFIKRYSGSSLYHPFPNSNWDYHWNQKRYWCEERINIWENSSHAFLHAASNHSEYLYQVQIQTPENSLLHIYRLKMCDILPLFVADENNALSAGFS